MAILKWLGKIDAPLTKGLLRPFRGDRVLADGKRCEPDRLYQQRVWDDVDAFLRAAGFELAA